MVKGGRDRYRPMPTVGRLMGLNSGVLGSSQDRGELVVASEKRVQNRQKCTPSLSRKIRCRQLAANRTSQQPNRCRAHPPFMRAEQYVPYDSGSSMPH